MAPRRAQNTNRQGANFELQVMHDLERFGYTTMRSSGSRGAVDVLGFADGHILMIQCKITNPVLPPKERRAVIALADTLLEYTVPLVAYRIRGRVMYRILTGTGPKDFSLWSPNPLLGALCVCGHSMAEHSWDGCWSGVYDCLCPAFELTST